MSGLSVLKEFQQKYPSLKEHLLSIEENYNKSLWHNLSSTLETVVFSQELQNDDKDLLKLYEQLITKFDLKISNLKLAQIVTYIASKLKDEKRAFELVGENLQKIEKKGTENEKKESIIILNIGKAKLYLNINEHLKCKKLLEKIQFQIDQQGYVENVVNSEYYLTKSNYLKATDQLNEYYKTSLLYLSYTNLDEVPLNKKRSFAFEIGLSALLGDKIYNFGELLSNPLVETLKGTQVEWLRDILHAYNKGDIAQFKHIMESNSSVIETSLPLKSKQKFLHQKIQIMSILELIFSREAGHRIVSFEELEKATGSSNEQIEHLLLKSLSLGLIKGTIDEVSQTIQVDWVQPRVLDRPQIETVSNKIGKWLETISETESVLLKSY